MIPLEELHVYKIAMEIGDLAWDIVEKWPNFPRQTLGGQLVRSADSMAFNIAEGYGRYFYKENRNFCYYSRGSGKEFGSAIIKAKNRNLITEAEKILLEEKLLSYFRLINKYIKSIGKTDPDPETGQSTNDPTDQ